MKIIKMANKGRGNLSRVLFGSAAEKVFRHSPALSGARGQCKEQGYL